MASGCPVAPLFGRLNHPLVVRAMDMGSGGLTFPWRVGGKLARGLDQETIY